jgi:hypothetical protein
MPILPRNWAGAKNLCFFVPALVLIPNPAEPEPNRMDRIYRIKPGFNILNILLILFQNPCTLARNRQGGQKARISFVSSNAVKRSGFC